MNVEVTLAQNLASFPVVGIDIRKLVAIREQSKLLHILQAELPQLFNWQLLF